jgi:CRISPR-associated protein Csx3
VNPWPAVMIGGPPHSGKSVLVYSLTQMLRKRKVEHYVLRACPDGEGDFSQEADQTTVRKLRHKGRFTPAYIERICQALDGRLLPLLVDVGGKPRPHQEVIFQRCTHAILLASTPEGLAEWRERAQRHGMSVIAELRSDLTGADAITGTSPLLTGTIAGLVRGERIEGPVVAALCDALQTLFDYPESELRTAHLQAAPLELVVELDRLAYTPGFSPQSGRWQPAQLADLLTYLPAATPLALYGRAPIWVYMAAMVHARPARCHQFDPRLGWVAPTPVQLARGRVSRQIDWVQRLLPGGETLLEVNFAGEPYLDYSELKRVRAPAYSGAGGLIISGRPPMWLLTGLALAYCKTTPWLAVNYPPLGQAVVVAAQTPAMQAGQTMPLAL